MTATRLIESSGATMSTIHQTPKWGSAIPGHAVIVGAPACRLVRVGGIEAAEITRGEAAALADEGTGTENGSLRRHGELDSLRLHSPQPLCKGTAALCHGQLRESGVPRYLRPSNATEAALTPARGGGIVKRL